MFLFSIFKVVSLFPLSTFCGKTCSRKNKRKQSAAEKDNNPTHGAGPSNKQRKPSGNEMDNRIETLAKELELTKKGLSKVKAQLKDSRAEMALVMEQYKETKDRDRSFKLLAGSLKICNEQFERIVDEFTDYEYLKRMKLVEQRARDNEIKLATLMKVGFLVPTEVPKSSAVGKAEERNEKIIINPDDWKKWNFLQPKSVQHERPTFHCPFFDKDGCIFIDEASVNAKQENLWHSYGAWDVALKGKAQQCKAKQCCHWSFGPTLVQSKKYGFEGPNTLLHFPREDHNNVLETNNKFLVRTHLKEVHGMTEDMISNQYPTLGSDRKSKKLDPKRVIIDILDEDVSNDKDPGSK